MVHLKPMLLCAFRTTRKYNFKDATRINVKSGAGGSGIPQMGGTGGKGSDMYLVAKEGLTFSRFLNANRSKRFQGVNGENSKKHCLCAAPADDCEIQIPEGVTVSSDKGKVLGDLSKNGDKVLVCHGGDGGNSFNDFYGQRGNTVTLKLDLKLIADVGYVGFPNAGKTSLLRALSKVKPKVADYLFTTLRPKLGVAKYKDLRQITMADLPGIIEGAHLNHGLGHRFLKHVERTSFLFVVVDLHGFQLGPEYPHRDVFQSVVLLNKELELFKENLTKKPAILVINKADKIDSSEKLRQFKHQWDNYEESIEIVEEKWRPKQKFEFDDIIPVSAMLGYGTDHLKIRLRELIDFHTELQMKEE